MTAFIKRIIIIGFCIVFVSGCATSQKEAVQDSQKAVTTIFRDKIHNANAQADHFTYYKPSTLTISQKGEHNIIFHDFNENIYILFVNPVEDKLSKMNYEAALRDKNKGDTLKQFKAGNTFLYIYVKPLKGDKKVELVVDGGGVKMSTKTTLDHLVEKSKIMAEMIHSVKIKKRGEEG